MPQIAPMKALIAESGHDVIPMRGVTQDRGGDPANPGAGGQPGIRVGVNDVQAAGDQLAPFLDDGHFPCACLLVALSISPPGPGVVWRRTVQIQVRVSISARRTPDTSPKCGRLCRQRR